MATFTELVQAVQNHPKLFTVGTVTAVDEGTMSCKITPEDGGEVVDKVPIRVMRHANQIGFSVVPKVGTEVIVMWLDEYRPTIFQIHEWAKVVVLDKSGIGFTIENGIIRLGKEKVKKHPVAWGEVLEKYLDKDEIDPTKSLLTWLAIKLGATPPAPPKFTSDEVKVS
ncbi:MAG: hypothetical protein V3W11_06345 [bacterium]